LALADDPELRAGRAAWEEFKAAEELGLDQRLQIGRALLVGRRHAMQAAGAAVPVGAPYSRALKGWCEAEGFADLPLPWRMDLLWCATHETEVVGAYELQTATRSRPSINPRTLRQSVTKIAREGAPRRRAAPIVATMPLGNLCDQLAARLRARGGAEALAEIRAIATTLEEVAREALAGG